MPPLPEAEPPWDLIRQFVEEMAAHEGASQKTIDWNRIQSAAGGAETVERAIGRAVVVAREDLADDSRSALRQQWTTPIWSAWSKAKNILAANGRVARPRSGYSIVASGLLLAVAVTAGYLLASGNPATLSHHALSVTGIDGNAAFIGGSNNAATSPAVALSDLPAASAPPAPAPPSLAGAAPLQSHEVFGFVPYWTLPDSAGFNIAGVSTLAYFSLDVNGDGGLSKTGPGWNGYQSQTLADLVTRAHGAGDRVVLTVSCFDQSVLDQLTSSPTAPATLAAALISAMQAKNLDGVNLDFEGQGSHDQAGLTHLVAQVSAEIHQVTPHYQVTMDTYATSAGDTTGFYDIRALAPAVDAFFVMQYQLNLQGTTAAASSLTSGMFSDRATIDQYTAAVPASKIILGLPFFGIDWPTTNGTFAAQATGPSTTVDDAQVIASGHPIYWDAITDTAWTSYEVGSQWHETFFEDPASLYDAAKLAGSSHLGGVGVWALGMEGDAPDMLSAVQGLSPALKPGAVGPTTTTTSTSSTTTTSTAPTTTSTLPLSSTTTTTTSTTTTAPTTTTTTLSYSGTWLGSPVVLTPVSGSDIPTQSGPTPAGQLTGFATNDATMSCLSSASSLAVWAVSGSNDEFLVVATTPGDCTNADFIFHTPS